MRECARRRDEPLASRPGGLQYGAVGNAELVYGRTLANLGERRRTMPPDPQKTPKQARGRRHRPQAEEGAALHGGLSQR